MEYLIHIAILITIYGILALSLNLIVGYTGLLSITQAAFYGIGAYTTAILLTRFNVNFFLTIFIGLVVTAIISFLVGFVLSKFNGDYYALGSFGFNVIVWSVMLNWQSLTRGPLGIPGINRPNIFGFELNDNLYFLIFSGLVAFGIYLISKYISESSFGRVLKSIREDEKISEIFGYNTLWYKLCIFVIGAMFASISGSIFATYITFIDPSTFNLNESIFILAIIIFGGLAKNKGAMLGATCLIVLPEILRFVGFPSDIAAQMRQLTYGIILVLFMLYRPQGLLGEYRL